MMAEASNAPPPAENPRAADASVSEQTNPQVRSGFPRSHTYAYQTKHRREVSRCRVDMNRIDHCDGREHAQAHTLVPGVGCAVGQLVWRANALDERDTNSPG